MEFPQEEKGRLEKLFRIPPLSLLDSRNSRWIERKKYWLSLGIKGELGRGENLLHDCDLMKRMKLNTTSVFDPVLCECIYLWFSKKGDKILDPFAGGSVRGIVASKLKRNYTGIELSEKQVQSNRIQSKEICPERQPKWIVDDAKNINDVPGSFNLLFSCPPYFNLEKYSEDKKDLSNMSLDDFFIAYLQIILRACSMLENDSFAVFVVGEVRHKGEYIGLIPETIEAFRTAGLLYYNEMILLQPVVTAAMRCERCLNYSRKIPKAHQQVLVFVKGDPIRAAKKLGKIKLI